MYQAYLLTTCFHLVNFFSLSWFLSDEIKLLPVPLYLNMSWLAYLAYNLKLKPELLNISYLTLDSETLEKNKTNMREEFRLGILMLDTTTIDSEDVGLNIYPSTAF